MKLTWRGPLLAVAGGAALILGAACGSDSETTTATPSTGGSTAAATAAPTEDPKAGWPAFVDPASTSGHLAPKTLLIQQGIDPDSEMKTVFAGSHPTAVLALENDNVVAAATHENNLLNLIKEGQVNGCFYADGIANRGTPRTPEEIKQTADACEDGKIIILAQTDPIPNTPFAVRSDLPETLKQAMKDALLAIKDDPEAVALDRRWFVDPTEELGYTHLDQYYNSLRDIAKLLDLDLKELAES